jgi:hypothetical protein
LVRIADLTVPCVEAVKHDDDYAFQLEGLESVSVSAEQFEQIVAQTLVLAQSSASPA